MENQEVNTINYTNRYYKIKLSNGFWVISFEKNQNMLFPTIKLTNKLSGSGLFFKDQVQKLLEFYPDLVVYDLTGHYVINLNSSVK